MTERNRTGEILDPEREINQILREHTETADWLYKEPAKFLNTVGDLAMERYFNGIEYPDGRKVPNPVTAFRLLRKHNTLAQYDLFPDEYGILYKITHNTFHFEEKEGVMLPKNGRWGVSETHVHEMIHAWQQTVGKDPYKQKKHGHDTHNAEFVRKAKDLGLNVFPVVGYHFAPADENSPFSILMKDLGIERPKEEIVIEGKPKTDWFRLKPVKGRSTLAKWSCKCPHNIRVGEKEWPGAKCNECGTQYIKADKGDIYKAK